MTKSLSAARRVFVGLILSGCTGWAAAQSQAQGVSAENAPAPSNGIEEVVVTALKRDTTLQETPISISAVTGASLANAGIQDLTNLTHAVPSLTFEDAGPTGTRITIRGIRSVGEPTVGIYYDETPISGAVGAGNDSG